MVKYFFSLKYLFLDFIFGQCSGSCGQGEMQRFIGCYQGNREVEGHQCDQSRKPDTVISCEMAECPVWRQGEWEPVRGTSTFVKPLRMRIETLAIFVTNF